MADRLMLLKRLRPYGIEFWPYSENPIKIDSAPKLWSTHRYITEKGYHYKIDMISNDSILIQLESVCPKGSITFKEINLNISDFVRMINTAFNEYSNFISVPIDISFSDSSKCRGCLRENISCNLLLNERPEKATLKIYFSQEDIKSALDYYKNNGNYKRNTSIDDKTVETVSTTTVSSYNKIKKERTNMNENPMANQMSNFLGFQCGVIDNPNIAATMLGICFRNESGNWIKFSPETGQRVDMGNIQIGNLGPLFLIPSRTVEVGTPIMYENSFYYVMDCSDEPKLKLLSVATGEEKTVYPSKNLLGLNFFAKVVALIDANNLLGGDSDDLITVMALTGGLNTTSGDANSQNQFINMIALSTILNGEEGGLLGGLTNGSLFGNLNGAGDEPLGKLIPILALTGGLNGSSNNQALGGMDLNTLLIMSALTKKDTKKSSTFKKPPTVAPKKEVPTISYESIQKMIKDAVSELAISSSTPVKEEEKDHDETPSTPEE